LGFEDLLTRHITRIRKYQMKDYDEEVNEWIKMAREKDDAEIEEMMEVEDAMEDNYYYNLKTGFNIMSITPHFSSSAIGTILLKCAQCMSSQKSKGTMPLCHHHCPIWYFMREEKYKLPDKKVSQSK
jgi:hypothetical protein